MHPFFPSEAQNQQLQQQYQQHQHQPQHYASQNFYTQQIGAYGQINQANYSGNQYPQHSHHQQQQLSAPYQSSHSNAYQQQPHQQFVQPQFADFQSPVTSAAAVVALSQLIQLSGTIGAQRPVNGLPVGVASYNLTRGHGPVPFPAEDPMWPPVCGSLHTGDGRNAVQPFRRHAQGSHGHLLRRSDCSGISFHGQGHGRNQGRVGTIKGSSNPKSSVTEDVKLESTFEKAKPSDAPERPSEAAVAPKKSLCEPAAEGDEALNNQSQWFAWCKICNIYCTSREILQQHKVGKRHRRNMQNVVTVNKTTKSGDELQNKQIPAPQSKVEVSQQLQNKQDSEETVPKENLTTEVFGDENKVENAQRCNGEGGQPNVPKELLSDLQATKSRMDQFDNGKRGMKRKMKGGRGGKQIRLVEAANEATALPKPLAVIPLLCVLCNVKCDKQEAFDSHLSGKKHLAKLRQFGGQHGTYKPVGLQVLYPPNPDIETLSLTQVHH